MGVTCARFAATNRATFEVMYRPDRFHADDPAFRAARGVAAYLFHPGPSPSPPRG